MSDEKQDIFDADAVRKAFEESFLTYFGQGPRDALFDQPGEFWLKRRADGRYEETRVADAWTGWLAAARRYAHIETMARVAQRELSRGEIARLAAQYEDMPVAYPEITPKCCAFTAEQLEGFVRAVLAAGGRQ